jgi:formylglycine-generating enzyme required for sulfatase activity
MKDRCSISVRSLLLGGFVLVVGSAQPSTAIEWVAIGDPGNADDTQPQGPFGGVDYAYSISKFETTNAEYAAFLNAKAASDPLGLYDPSMGTDAHGGITRTGSSGSYTYTTKAGFEDEAVNFVTFYDALRFANWVHNGEGSGDTETGAYTLLGGTETPSNGSSIVRSPAATVVLPNQDEWFKAAYYNGTGDLYYDYPTGTDAVPTCGSPTATPNRANCGNSTIRGVTPVGSYAGSPSPYGTFDQGGNVAEWNENTAFGGGRAVRGGGWTGLTTPLKASSAGSFAPTTDNSALGFRLALLEADPGGGPLDIAEIRVSKRVERTDGDPMADTYLFEACVSGSGILFADVTPPGRSPVLLQPTPFGGLCFFDFFDDVASLDLAYTSGPYVFSVFGSSEVDSKTLTLQADEPRAYLDILSPSDGAVIAEDQDLDFTWMLVEKGNGVGCIAATTCADGISVEIDEFAASGFQTIVDERLPTTASGTVLFASEIVADAEYDASIGAFTGTSDPSDTTDMGDAVATLATYEDVNRIFVLAAPEPAASALAMTALVTLAAMRRARTART